MDIIVSLPTIALRNPVEYQDCLLLHVQKLAKHQGMEMRKEPLHLLPDIAKNKSERKCFVTGKCSKHRLHAQTSNICTAVRLPTAYVICFYAASSTADSNVLTEVPILRLKKHGYVEVENTPARDGE